MAKRVFGDYTVTPTLTLISDALVDAIENPNRRYIISTPPRTGKSVLVSQVGTVFALMRNPDHQLILKSYSDELAEEHSREARRLIDENTDLLGFRLDKDKTSSARWKVADRKGGLLAGGIFTSTTGFGAHLLLVDDPVKGAQDADSPSTRRRLMAEFRSSLLTRRMPGASVVIVMTRWHEQDLAAELLAEGGWRRINIPAVSTPGVPDALRRRHGAPMTTALGEVDFEATKREVGSRTWAAMYLGVPSAPEGGLIQRSWIDDHRVPIAPPHPVRTVVTVDPADSGERDAAGVIAASLTADGRVHLIADRSGKMTSDQWARATIALARDVGASEIHVEAFASGTTYVRIVREALDRTEGVSYISVRGWPPKGKPRKGDAVARAAPMLQALETGRCVIAGSLPDFEAAAVQWQAGQHQPDQLAAAVIAFDVLAPIAGQQAVLTAPMRKSDRPPPEWMTRSLRGRPGIGRPGTTVPSAHGRPLSRSVRGGGYDPLAYVRW
ncbi:terminase large subunit domain-containing protein [Mycobacterium paraense]|uniref:terminase large subunit domain-containing protein n=1 Tax=Mycobacterium paraense TaxID=767916 RepID=UPI001F4E99C0|nr:terminase family protein [Mycobacterium paraense]